MTWLVIAKDVGIGAAGHLMGWAIWTRRPRRLDVALFCLALAGLWIANDLRLIGAWPTAVATAVACLVFGIAGRLDARDAGPQRPPGAR